MGMDTYMIAGRYLGAAGMSSYMYGQPYLSLDNAMAAWGYMLTDEIALKVLPDDDKGYRMWLSMGLQVGGLVYIGGLSVQESAVLLGGAYLGEYVAQMVASKGSSGGGSSGGSSY
jgi:hypothetical protein